LIKSRHSSFKLTPWFWLSRVMTSTVSKSNSCVLLG
jgi:hypothetical protein